MEIVIQYNGGYPNLCRGKLIVTIDTEVWEFPDYCLISGGSAYFDRNWDEVVTRGDWSVGEWPDDFPEELKQPVLDKINDVLPHGCCGGCI